MLHGQQNVKFLEHSEPLQACNGTALLLPFTLYCTHTVLYSILVTVNCPHCPGGVIQAPFVLCQLRTESL